MTETKIKRPRFVRVNLFIDILMSFVFCLSTMSLSVVMRWYLQLFELDYAHILTTLVPAILFVFIRRFRIRLLPMLLAHVSCMAVYVYVMYQVLKLQGGSLAAVCAVFLGIACFAVFIYSMKQRMRTTIAHVTYDVFITSFTLQIVLYILCVILKAESCTGYILSHAVIIALLYFIARQIYTFDNRYYHNLHSPTQPVSKIKKQNYMTISTIFGGTFVALLLLFFFPTEGLTRIITKIIRVIVYIVYKIADFLSFKDLGETDYGGEGTDLSSLIGSGDDGYEPTILTKIIVVIIIMALACVVVYLTISAIRLFIKMFRQAEETERVVENESVVDIIENLTPKKSHVFRNEKKDFGSGEEKEVRKKYYRTVQKAIYSGADIRSSSSPKQIESVLKEKGDQSISELTSRYQSVRYGKKEE